MKLLWNICAAKLYHIITWLVFTVQSVTVVRRASIKWRYGLKMLKMRSLKGNSHADCSQSFLSNQKSENWFLLLGHSLIDCASVHCLRGLLKSKSSIEFYFFLWSFSIATNATPDKADALYRWCIHVVVLTSVPSMSRFSGAVCARVHWLAAALGKWALGAERPG